MARVTRNTQQRRLVSDEIKRRSDHPTAEAVYEAVRAISATMSRGTVYRNLSVLAELGELRRIKVPVGADRFDSRTEPHYHFICTECGGVWDADIPYMSELDERVAEAGYTVGGHKLVFYGVCPGCSKK